MKVESVDVSVSKDVKILSNGQPRENDIGCLFYETSLGYEPLLGGEFVLGLATLKELGLQEREG